MRRFEFSEGTSNKFWQITQDGEKLTITFGKIGTAGQTQLKELVTESAAKAEADKLIKEKTKKGYAEVDAADAPAAPAPKPKPEAAAKPAAKKAAKAEAAAPEPAPLPKAGPAPQPVVLADGVEPWVIEERVLPAPAKAARAASFDASQALDAARTALAGDEHTTRVNAAGSAAELRPAISAMLSFVAGKPLDRDPEAVGLILAINAWPTFDLLEWYARTEGFERAVQAFLAASRVTWNSDYAQGKSTYTVRAAKPEDYAHENGVHVLAKLRSELPAQDVEAGIALLRAARRTEPNLKRRVYFNQIVRDQSWAKEDAAQLEKGYAHSDHARAVMDVLEDLDVLRNVARMFSDQVRRVELVDRLGLPAVPIALLGWTEYGGDDFMRLQTVAVAKQYLELLPNKRENEHARAYYAARPDLAILVLAPAVASGNKYAPFAKAPLAAAIAAQPDLPARMAHLLDAKTRAFLFAPPAERAPDAPLASLPPALQKLSADGLPKKQTPLPDFVGELPQVHLRDRKSGLPEAAVAILLTSLRYSKIATSKKDDDDKLVVTPGTELPAVTAAKEACDPADLADLAWTLFEAWQAAEAPKKEDWAFTALGVLGTDDTARRLTPLVRAWPGESLHARATLGLDVLAAIGTDVALMHLHGVAQKLKFKSVQEKAREKIAAVAEARGFTPDELADRLVPDFDLGDEGGNVLDFGPRQFTISFDETLKPHLKGEGGKVVSDLPKPAKSDDAEKAAAATERWKLLKKDAKTIAAGQVLRLELAMCSERTWRVDVFRTFLVEHPVVGHLVRRLVWGTQGAKGAVQHTFRVAEDGTFANDSDDTFTLPDDATVVLPHRLALSAAQLGAWGQIFADYGILQPFDQLGRATHSLDPKQASATELDTLKGVEVKTGKVLGLEARGWRKGEAQDAGWVYWMWRPVGDGLVATLGFDGGICMGWAEGTPAVQKLTGVSLTHGQAYRAEAAPLSKLSKTAYSELVREIEGLAG